MVLQWSLMRRQAQIPWLGLLLLLAGVIDRLFLPLSHLPTHVLLVMGVALIAFHAGVFGAAGAMAVAAVVTVSADGPPTVVQIAGTS